MATALISALSGRPVNHLAAMTGEITLRGRVLPIGGLKEKTLAAFRIGIKTIVIPYENKPDYDELPAKIKDNIHFVFAKNMDKVLETVLMPSGKPNKQPLKNDMTYIETILAGDEHKTSVTAKGK